MRKRIPPLIRAALHALLSPSRPTGATQSLQTSLETESPKVRRASSSILLRCKDCKGINHVNSTAFPRRFQTPTIFPSRRILGRTIPASVNTPRRASSGRNGASPGGIHPGGASLHSGDRNQCHGGLLQRRFRLPEGPGGQTRGYDRQRLGLGGFHEGFFPGIGSVREG